MNIIISNENKQVLDNLDIDVIKNINGIYSGYEISEMFQNFYFNKLILDATSIKNNHDIKAYKKLIEKLSPDKIILFLKENTDMCSPGFLASLINIGIYNFTSKSDGIKYLLEKSNTYEDVKEIYELGKHEVIINEQNINDNPKENKPHEINLNVVLGIKNVTKEAGSTTLTYILKKELESIYHNKIICIEINKKDFIYFNDNAMISVQEDKLKETIENYKGKAIILIDYGEYDDYSYATDMIYLLEPSTLKLNKLLRLNSSILGKLKTKKVILNKSLLNSKDVNEFEYESGIKIYFNLPPLDERKQNEIVNNLICKLGLAVQNTNKQSGSKIFGLFKR